MGKQGDIITKREAVKEAQKLMSKQKTFIHYR